MPTITLPSNTQALVVPTSPVSPVSRSDRVHLSLIPITLRNGCTEEDCTIESDNPYLTNVIRRHFLEHFGHRDLDAIVMDYAPDAVMVNVVNGERKSYHGRDRIREAFVEIFGLHPTVTSTFSLRQIVVEGKNGSASWTASTPTHLFPNSSDTFVFNDDGMISKHHFMCECTTLDTPWYVE